MKIKTRGIVLHTTKYSETSLVVKIYTEESGLLSCIVGGVRTKNSKFKSSFFQPLSLVELVASGKQGQSLLRITDIHLSPPFVSVSGNVIKSTIAIFLAEVIYRSIREEEPNPSLFQFMHSGIQILDMSHENCSRFHLYFLIHLTRYTGFYPNGECIAGQSLFDLSEGSFTLRIPSHPYVMEPALANLLWQYLQRNFENHHEVIISNERALKLLEHLITYYELHLTHGQSIRSHKILSEVLH